MSLDFNKLIMADDDGRWSSSLSCVDLNFKDEREDRSSLLNTDSLIFQREKNCRFSITSQMLGCPVDPRELDHIGISKNGKHYFVPFHFYLSEE